MDYVERKSQAFRLLNELYDSLEGIVDEGHFVYSNVLAERLNLDEPTTIAYYLQGKNLVKIGPKVSGANFLTVSITKEGITEVEAARDNRETPIERLPPGAYNQIIVQGNVLGGVISQGGSNVINAKSTVNITENEIDKFREFLNLLKSEYNNYDMNVDQKSVVEGDMRILDAAVSSPKPSLTVIKEVARNIWETVKPFASDALKLLGMSLIVGRLSN